MLMLLVLIAIITFLFWKLKKHYNYWNDKGVKQNKQFYLLGDNVRVFFKRESFFDLMIKLYNSFPKERYMGVYQGMLQTLLIRDPELIKQITVKDFDHFLNHRQFVPDESDPLWSRNLFALRDTTWRDMRSTLSPSFTSSKMKIIFTLMSDCANEYVNYFLKNKGTTEIELKDTFTRYTNDVIATVAFGVNCDSINVKDNEFYMMGKKATTFGFVRFLKFLLYAIVPGICKWINLKMFPDEISNFFVKLIKESIHIRETQGIFRPDMINLLLEARKGRKFEETLNTEDAGFATAQESAVHGTNKAVKQELTDMDIAAQALVFFFAGFDTVATAMCFIGYELTLNPDIQQKLQQEVDDTLKECNGKITYEALLKMKYMDMVVSESLRKWPAALGTDRVCSKSFTIEPTKPHERAVSLKPGDIILIPINGIHRDPQYYPNPDVFNPERFSDENKGNIKPYTYMPFGLGPRNCIGSRFALLEIKIIIFYLLSKFSMVAIEKTQIPIVLSKKNFSILAENGVWIGLEPRV